MNRKTRLLAVALAAAAIAPAAHATIVYPPVDAGSADTFPVDDPGYALPPSAPAAAKAITVATLITDNSPSQNRIARHNLRAIAAAKKHVTVPFITDNSPSQNRVAPRKVAVTRTLASSLRTFPG